MNLNNIADKIVFKSLKFIKHGNLKLINYDNKSYIFGNLKSEPRVTLKINKPGLTYKVIKSGSVGLAESYMRGDFETDSLTNLIELTAKNIKLIYKFSGLLDFPKSIILKVALLKITSLEAKKILQNIMI